MLVCTFLGIRHIVLYGIRSSIRNDGFLLASISTFIKSFWSCWYHCVQLLRFDIPVLPVGYRASLCLDNPPRSLILHQQTFRGRHSSKIKNNPASVFENIWNLESSPVLPSFCSCHSSSIVCLAFPKPDIGISSWSTWGWVCDDLIFEFYGFFHPFWFFPSFPEIICFWIFDVVISCVHPLPFQCGNWKFDHPWYRRIKPTSMARST